MMIPEVEQFVLDRIAAAELVRHPVPHIYVAGLFPERFYPELLQNLPPTIATPHVRRPYDARLEINLNASERPSWERFWWGLRNG